MWAYIVRRLLLTIPIVLGILLITFVLFNVVAPDPAIVYAGKQRSPEQLQALRHKIGTDKPRWLNIAAMHKEGIGGLFDSQFIDVLRFNFHESLRFQEPVWTLFKRKAPVSLAIQFPAFLIELGLQLVLALYVASHRGRPVDYTITFLSVLGLSIPSLSIYLAAQWLFAGKLEWFPVAGWGTNWFYAIHFAALPILVTVIIGLGGGTRFYRTIALEEINSDYVRTARAKGVPPRDVLLTHVLRNVMIPVVTNTVVVLPFLLTGALILEKLFQIPGFGSLLVEAINGQDGHLVMAIVYLTSVAYCLLLLVTDLCYALVDPRVSLR